VSVLDWALAYRTHGFSLLPLAGKEPHHRLINRTHSTRSTNKLLELGQTEEQLREWFSRPDVNIGVFCGEASSGLVVVDLDDCAFPCPARRCR
jgi:hypothetical protein